MSNSNPIVKLNNVRLSFPALWTPQANQDDANAKPKFGATFLMDKKANAKDIAALKAAVEQVRTTAEVLKGQKKSPKLPIRDGAEKEHLEGYSADVVFISAKSITRPGVVDQKLSPLAEADGKLRTARGEDIFRTQGAATALAELIADITSAEKRLTQAASTRQRVTA